MFSRLETRFFQFCSFLNMWNNLRVFYNHLVFNGRLSTHLDSVFTKKTVSTLPNTDTTRIFMRAEISNWYLKTQLGFILTVSKNVQDWIHFLLSIRVMIVHATPDWVETSLNHYYSEALNSGHLRFLKNLSVIKRCPLLGGSKTKIVTFGTKHFACYSRHALYLRCLLLGGFTVFF